jgi:tRNA(adenine34) deaminase
VFKEEDHYWLQQAITLAKHAAFIGEVPVGAILVYQNEIMGSGFNRPIATNDPTAHAEMTALRNSALKIGNYRLLNTTLYVTLEPCIMCAGAIVHSRIKRLVFGASDAKAGAIVSKTNILDQPFLNHRVEYAGGLLAEQCGNLLSCFFRERRESS